MPTGMAKAVRKVGSVRRLATMLGVDRKSVRDYLKDGPPAKRAKQVRELTGVSLHALRPDLW